jgi:hypothetical protein
MHTFNVLCLSKVIQVHHSHPPLNLKKTVGVYLWKWRNKIPRFKNIKWSTKPVEALGVFHGYAIDLEMIWLEKINLTCFALVK